MGRTMGKDLWVIKLHRSYSGQIITLLAVIFGRSDACLQKCLEALPSFMQKRSLS